MLNVFFGIEFKFTELYSEEFCENFAKEITYHNYCDRGDISGTDWEKIFAASMNLPWKRNNNSTDIQDQNTSTAWSAKTVATSSGGRVNLKKSRITLIIGRISPLEDFNVSIDPKRDDPAYVGDLVFKVWNNRVIKVKSAFQNYKTIVLIRNKLLTDFFIFDYDTEMLNASDFRWAWNKNNNLYAYDSNDVINFVWQPKGGQFSISKQLPDSMQKISVKKPPTVSKEEILEHVKFSKQSYSCDYG